MEANCASFLTLIDRFRSLTQNRQVPVEVWAVGSEIECHPTFGNPSLRSYAQSKRAYAQAAARLMLDQGLLYRHIVPSAFRSPMGPGEMSGRTAAAITLWLIRRGFRYVPVTYTGIAFVNFIPFFLRGLLAGPQAPRRPRFSRALPRLEVVGLRELVAAQVTELEARDEQVCERLERPRLRDWQAGLETDLGAEGTRLRRYEAAADRLFRSAWRELEALREERGEPLMPRSERELPPEPAA